MSQIERRVVVVNHPTVLMTDDCDYRDLLRPETKARLEGYKFDPGSDRPTVVAVQAKRCSTYGATKSTDEFYQRSDRPGKYWPACKVCSRRKAGVRRR